MSKNQVVGSFSVEVTGEQVEAIIVNAFEGGSTYWVGLDNTGSEWANKPQGKPLSMWAVKLLLEGKTVHLYDLEDDSEKWELTLAKIIAGVQQNHKARPSDSDIIEGDAETADCILQYALFNELVYG